MSENVKRTRTNKATKSELAFKPFAGVELEVVLSLDIKHPKDLTQLPVGTYQKRVIVDLRNLVESPTDLAVVEGKD
jgi:hypothetical protein